MTYSWQATGQGADQLTYRASLNGGAEFDGECVLTCITCCSSMTPIPFSFSHFSLHLQPDWTGSRRVHSSCEGYPEWRSGTGV